MNFHMKIASLTSLDPWTAERVSKDLSKRREYRTIYFKQADKLVSG